MTSQYWPKNLLAYDETEGDADTGEISRQTSTMLSECAEASAPVAEASAPVNRESGIDKQRVLGASEADIEDGEVGRSLGIFIDNINYGDHVLALSEEASLLWMSLALEIEDVLTAGEIPFFDIDSAGLDPRSTNHFQKMVSMIEEKLLSVRIAEAVSYLHGFLRVFKNTLLIPAALATPEVELLKRIYFINVGSGFGTNY